LGKKAETEGIAKDLAEKLRKGEITPKEAKEEMYKRGLDKQENWRWGVYTVSAWSTYFVLLLLPTWSRHFNLDFLKFFAQLPAINFPLIVKVVSLVFVFVWTCSSAWATHLHRKRGGLKGTDETIILYREGPYSVMRHPMALMFMVWFTFLPIVGSEFVRFTLLSVVAIILINIHFYHTAYVEEEVNLKKWGDEYRKYLEEVPRFNFVKGLWNLRKRRK
jgi:protein-S-isoprenylcysteine O-methyltransferase Ste14